MDQIKIGKHIAEKRKALGLTQAALAQKLGVTDKSVSKWERGVCLPDVSLYQPLCELLGMSLNEFFTGESIAPEEESARAEENILGIAKDAQKKQKLSWKVIAALSIASIVLFAGLVTAAWRLGWFDKARDNYVRQTELSEEERTLTFMLEGLGNVYLYDYSAGPQYEHMSLFACEYSHNTLISETQIGGLSFKGSEGSNAGTLAIVFKQKDGTYTGSFRICIRDGQKGAFYAWDGEMSGMDGSSGYELFGVGAQLALSRISAGRTIELVEFTADREELNTMDPAYRLVLCCRFD